MLVLGNPSDHSVYYKMFFSYKKSSVKNKWREHRFWGALEKSGILTFHEKQDQPEPDNVVRINNYRKNALLSGDYEGDFNLFHHPYFSFPTPASGNFSGVAGIKNIFGGAIFAEYQLSEASRFEELVGAYGLKHVLCFHKRAREEIQAHTSEALKIFNAGPTRHILSNKSLTTLRSLADEVRKK